MHNIDELPTTKRLLRADIPETLHHYTNSTSIVAIINSRQFWAGLPEQMNDGEELHRAFRWLALIGGQANLDRDRPSADQLFGRWVSERIEDKEALKGAHSFVVSLSESGDSLSQWRSYTGGSGSGVSLSLPGQLVQTAAERQGWTLAPCIYDEADVEMLVAELFNHHLTKFAKEYDTFPGDDHTSFMTPLKNHAQNLFDDLRHYGLYVKNPSFHAEEEWRLAKFDVEPDVKDLTFSGGPLGVRAYLPFEILEPNQTSFPSQPRPALRIGPTPLSGIAVYATTRLLELWVGAGNTDVYETHSSFR